MKKIFIIVFTLLIASNIVFANRIDVVGGGGSGATECVTSSCDLNVATTLNTQGICLADGTDCPATSGDSITVNSSAAANANFLDNLYVDWGLNTASTPDDITSKFNYAETLAGDPALLIDECIWAKDTSGGFILCEGSTADTAEQAYRLPDLNGSDTTEYFLVTAVSGSVGDGQIADSAVDGGTGGEIEDGTITAADLGTDSVSADELNATGVEAELESALDIGGEVTSTGMASTVIADSITVTGWVLGTSSATTLTAGTVNIDLLDGVGAVDMDYGSADITDHTFTTDGTGTAEIVLPAGSIDGTEILNGTIALADTAITAGRSLTIATDDIAADAELFTDTKCAWWENPVATDDFKSIWFAKQAATLTSIWAESDQTVTFMLQVDDGSAADVDSVAPPPAAGTAEDTSLDGDATMAAGDRLDMAVTSVASTPTFVSVCWTFTYDD